MMTITITTDITLTGSEALCRQYQADGFDPLTAVAKRGDFDAFSDMFKDAHGFRPSRDMMALYASH